MKFFFKFLAAVLLIPVVIAATTSLNSQFASFPVMFYRVFLIGATTFVFVYLFVWDFDPLHQLALKILQPLFAFFPPLVKCIPLYTWIALIIYYVFRQTGELQTGHSYLYAFAMGFFLAMHVIIVARDLYEEDGAPGKPDYCWRMTSTYVVTLFLFAVLLSIVFPHFHCVEYFQDTFYKTVDIYQMVGRQLF